MRKARAPCHQPSRQPADIRTISIELNTQDHRLHIILSKASTGTVLTFARAIITGVDTGAEFFVSHRNLRLVFQP